MSVPTSSSSRKVGFETLQVEVQLQILCERFDGAGWQTERGQLQANVESLSGLTARLLHSGDMVTSTAVSPHAAEKPPNADAGVRGTQRWWRDISAAALWLVLLFVTALWVGGGGINDLFRGAAAAVTSAGRLMGLVASAPPWCRYSRWRGSHWSNAHGDRRC